MGGHWSGREETGYEIYAVRYVVSHGGSNDLFESECLNSIIIVNNSILQNSKHKAGRTYLSSI